MQVATSQGRYGQKMPVGQSVLHLHRFSTRATSIVGQQIHSPSFNSAFFADIDAMGFSENILS